MICPPCRKQEHGACVNRIGSVSSQYGSEGSIITFTTPVLHTDEVTRTRCDCQHAPRGTDINQQTLTNRAESDSLKP